MHKSVPASAAAAAIGVPGLEEDVDGVSVPPFPLSRFSSSLSAVLLGSVITRLFSTTSLKCELLRVNVSSLRDVGAHCERRALG